MGELNAVPTKVRLFAPTPEVPGLPQVKELVPTPEKTVLAGWGLVNVADNVPATLAAWAESAIKEVATKAAEMIFLIFFFSE